MTGVDGKVFDDCFEIESIDRIFINQIFMDKIPSATDSLQKPFFNHTNRITIAIRKNVFKKKKKNYYLLNHSSRSESKTDV